VFTSFVGLIPKGFFITHKDGNIYNNNLSNLCLLSAFEIYNLDKSEFVQISGFPSYFINKKGLVLNIDNSNLVNWAYSKANKCMTVRLWINNTTKLFYIYRLIAIHFIPNPENKPQVNHIDGNRMNLDINNLEWVTGSENMKHAYKNGLTNGTFQKGVNNRFRHLI
jgi:hypothetical protein